MSQRGTVTWSRLCAICEQRGIEIKQGKGDDKKLKGPAPDGKVRVQTIGHNWTRSRNTDVPRAIVSAFKRNFGVTDEELYS